MEEELEQILANAETSNEEKQQAIKDLVSNNFVSKSQYNKRNEQLTQAQEDLRTNQEAFEAFKQAKMTEEEKKVDEENKKAAAYKAMSDRLSKSLAEGVFAKSGLDEKDYSEVLPNLIQSTPEATEELAKSVCAIMQKQKENIEASIANGIKNNTPKPSAGNAQNQNGLTDMEKLQEAYEKATNPIEQASILRQMNALEIKK